MAQVAEPEAPEIDEKGEKVTFESLGLCPELCESVKLLKWETPSGIQRDSLPYTLKGRDIIGLAETGSGKTGAFALPILQDLLQNPQKALFAVVLTPTRELAVQIAANFEALGARIGARAVVVVGGIDMMQQSIALSRPNTHIVVATPGRLVDHLENTKGFNLRSVKYVVLDEADRMLSMDFEEELNTILSAAPRERTTMLFSATMTSKVGKLQRASLKDPIKIEVSQKYQTVSTLIQQYLLAPPKYKDCYLAHILSEFAGQSALIFSGTCSTTQRLSLVLRNLGFAAVPLNGQMTQSRRLGALESFRSGKRKILIGTDVASRGLDIPAVDVVINFDVPLTAKDYVHRVGRTARAGRTGRAITFVCQYDFEQYSKIEAMLGQKLDAFPCDESAVLLSLQRVNDAQRLAAEEMREMDAKRKSGGKRKRGFKDDDGDFKSRGGGGKRRRRGR